jgi:hypothetical protein
MHPSCTLFVQRPAKNCETFTKPATNNGCHNSKTGSTFELFVMTRSKKSGLSFNP